MISAIVTCSGDQAGLAATLSCLTPAAIDGLVKEVIVAGAVSGEALAVAEDAGARLVAGPAGEAGRIARQPWLLILPAGARLQMRWEVAAQTHIRRHAGSAGWFRLNYARDGLAARLGEAWVNGLAGLGRVGPVHGLLVPAGRGVVAGALSCGLRPLEARILVGEIGAD